MDVLLSRFEHPHSQHFQRKILVEIKVLGALFLFLKELGLHRISTEKTKKCSGLMF